MRYCVKCGQEKDDSEFNEYISRKTGKLTYRRSCNICELINTSGYEDQAVKRNQILLDWSNAVPRYPNEYDTEGQRKVVSDFLSSIGWKYSPDTEKWFKEGIKDEQGNWENLKKFKRKRKIVTPEMKMEMKHLHDLGFSNAYIADKMLITPSTLYVHFPEFKIKKVGRPRNDEKN